MHPNVEQNGDAEMKHPSMQELAEMVWPPTDTANEVINALRRIDFTDQIASEKSVHTPAIAERQAQEARLAHNGQELETVRLNLASLQHRYETESKALLEQYKNDQKDLVSQAKSIVHAIRANEVAIAVLDGTS